MEELNDVIHLAKHTGSGDSYRYTFFTFNAPDTAYATEAGTSDSENFQVDTHNISDDEIPVTLPGTALSSMTLSTTSNEARGNIVKARNAASGAVDHVVLDIDGTKHEAFIRATESGSELPMLSSLAMADAVHLWWEPESTVTNYEVYRDGDLLGLSSGPGFIDDHPLPGVEHEYAIEGAHGMPYSELKDFDPEDMCSTIPEPEPGSQGTPISERDTAWLESCITTLSTDLEAGDEGDSASGEEIEEPEATTRSVSHILVPETDRAIVMEQLASLNDVHPTSAFSRFRHNSFIRAPRVRVFPCQLTTNYFRGDNRSYNMDSGQYRTRLAAHVYWSDRHIGEFRMVQPTAIEDANGNYIESRVGDHSRVFIHNTSFSSSGFTAHFHASHEASNPYCAVGAIWYEWVAQLQESNNYAIAGSHRRAPHHEIGAQSTSGAWRSAYAREGTNFQCLVSGLCTLKSIP